MKLLELVGRVVAVYLALLVMLRLAGRREMAEMSPMDLLTMLLVSETVSPALTGGNDTLAGGMVAAATLITLAAAVSYASYRSKRVARVIEGDPEILIRNGHVDPKQQRRFRISDEDLAGALRQHGVASVGEVRRAYVEPDGEITVLPKKPR